MDAPTCDGDGSHKELKTMYTGRRLQWKGGVAVVYTCGRCGRRKYVDTEE